jgi:hypothetical protein
MSTTILKQEMPFGLFELDESGTVLSARVEDESGKSGLANDLTGKDFFQEVAPFANGDEMRAKITRFILGAEIADSFRSTLCLGSGFTPVKVLLARIRELPNDKRNTSVLVYIKKLR